MAERTEAPGQAETLGAGYGPWFHRWLIETRDIGWKWPTEKEKIELAKPSNRVREVYHEA